MKRNKLNDNNDSTQDLFQNSDSEEGLFDLEDALTQIPVTPTPKRKKRKFDPFSQTPPSTRLLAGLDYESEEEITVTKWTLVLYSTMSKKSHLISGEWEEHGQFVISRNRFSKANIVDSSTALRISREHAIIKYELSKDDEHQFRIVDKSQGGILINGAEIPKNRHVEISSGDDIAILFKKVKGKPEVELGIRFECRSESKVLKKEPGTVSTNNQKKIIEMKKVKKSDKEEKFTEKEQKTTHEQKLDKDKEKQEKNKNVDLFKENKIKDIVIVEEKYEKKDVNEEKKNESEDEQEVEEEIDEKKGKKEKEEKQVKKEKEKDKNRNTTNNNLEEETTRKKAKTITKEKDENSDTGSHTPISQSSVPICDDFKISLNFGSKAKEFQQEGKKDLRKDFLPSQLISAHIKSVKQKNILKEQAPTKIPDNSPQLKESNQNTNTPVKTEKPKTKKLEKPLDQVDQARDRINQTPSAPVQTRKIPQKVVETPLSPVYQTVLSPTSYSPVHQEEAPSRPCSSAHPSGSKFLKGVQFAFVGYTIPIEQVEQDKKQLIASLQEQGALYLKKDQWAQLKTTTTPTLVVLNRSFWAKIWEYPWFMQARQNPFVRFLPDSKYLSQCDKEKVVLPLKGVEICSQHFGGILVIENSARPELPEIVKVIEKDFMLNKKWKLFVEDTSNGTEIRIGKEKEKRKVPLEILPKEGKLPEWNKHKEQVAKLDPFIQKVLFMQDANAIKARIVVVITKQPKLVSQAEHVQVLAFDTTGFQKWTENKEKDKTCQGLWLLDGNLAVL